MGHKVTFTSYRSEWNIVLPRQSVLDAIDLFYEGNDTTFIIVGVESKAGRRGSCLSVGGIHTITLSLSTIRQHLAENLRMGGNKTHASVKEAALSVLVHELQHANQNLKHDRNSRFWRGQYFTRPCEVDARGFADQQKDTISILTGKDMVSIINVGTAQEDNIESIIEVLSFSDGISLDDIIHELKAVGLYNSINVGRVMHELVQAGKTIL